MSSPEIPVLVKRLPHGQDLPLPAYATEGAAGMDVVIYDEVKVEPAPTSIPSVM